MEASELDRFYREESERAGLLAMAWADTDAAIREFMESGGWTFPVMLAPDDLVAAYGVEAVPALFLIDAESRIVDYILGGVTADQLSQMVDDLLR